MTVYCIYRRFSFHCITRVHIGHKWKTWVREPHTHTQKISVMVCLQSISHIWPKQACFLKLTCSFEMSILQETVCIDSLDAYLIWRGRLAALSFRTTLRLTAEELFNQVNGRKTPCRWNKSGVWSVASVHWRYVTSDLHNSCWTEKKVLLDL